MILFGFFALVLVSVYWINRAVLLFDRLIADGHSAGVFLEFTALSLPPVIQTVLPMATFAAAIYVTNRLSSDSELTVVQATGFSPWRLARPVLVFGLIVMLMMLTLSNSLVPRSLAQLKEREVEISGSVSARLLREGVFLHPSEGITFYIRDIDETGELRDVFLSDRSREDRSITYTAQSAFLLRSDDGPRLIMLRGMAQTLDHGTQRLATTNFFDFSYDISGLIVSDGDLSRSIRHIPTLELLTQLQAISRETGESPGRILEHAHSRFQKPILAVVAALIGFSTLLLGGFSRFGVGRQIVLAIFLLVIIKLVEGMVTSPVRASPVLWPLVYLPSLIGLGLASAFLAYAARPFRPRKRTLEAPA